MNRMRRILWLMLGLLCLPVCGSAGQLEPAGYVPSPAHNPQT
ncbi:MAG: hypothetical protein ACD_75C00763G0006, partial [uncultured bacterium]